MAGKGKPFEPGHDIKSPGRPKTPEEIKRIRELTTAEVIRIFNEYQTCTLVELGEKAKDPKTTVLEHLLISIAKHGIQKGDHSRATFLLDRVVGKVKETIEHSGDVGFKVVIEDHLSKK